MKVRIFSNGAIHKRINYFNKNITCIHYIIIVLLGLYSDTKFHYLPIYTINKSFFIFVCLISLLIFFLEIWLDLDV